jgi:hypothetical protein
MRSAEDCLAKAIDMERRAADCVVVAERAELLSMAHTWRNIAQQALWQDSYDPAARSPR